MRLTGVDCVFDEEGTVRVRRIRVDEKWRPITQGRQWLDEAGRHVLVMLDDRDVLELLLPAQTLIWQLNTIHGPGATMV